MALRHGYPGRVGCLVATEELVRPALRRPPVKVEFRRGANMENLAAEILSHPSVLLDAAVGAGKSTKVPPALARASGGLVVHVTPNPLLVLDLYGFLVKQQEAGVPYGTQLELWGPDLKSVPRKGVLMMSTAEFVALMEEKKADNLVGGVDWSNVVIFLDEAHESDMSTHNTRTLDFGARCLVQSSATLSPSGSRARETPGKLVKHRFPKGETPDTWRADDATKPWFFQHAQRNLLIFVDSRSQAAHLRREYENMGMLVFRLEARMPQVDFIKAMQALRDRKGPVVTLLADSSFRSGFTFDVGRIIDSGSVAYYDPTPGAVKRTHRVMCSSEMEQAAGRAGRIRNETVEYFYPDADIPAAICDLEGTEREAAAYMCRVLGFKPVGLLAGTIMATAVLPITVDPKVAMNGSYPLTYYVTDSRGRPRTPPPSSPGNSGPSSRATSIGTTASVPRTPGSMSDQEFVDGVDKPSYVDDEDFKDFVGALSADSPTKVEVGKYYRVLGVRADEGPTVAFPDGVRSVCKFIELPNSHLKVLGLPKQDRKSAISAAVNRYNLLNVEITAVVEVLRAESKKDKRMSMSRRKGLIDEFEELGSLKAERNYLLAAIVTMSARDFEVQEIPPLTHLVESRVKARLEAGRYGDDDHALDDYAGDLSAVMGSMADLSCDRSERGRIHGIYEHRRRIAEHMQVVVPGTGLFSRDRTVMVRRTSYKDGTSVRWSVAS